MLIDNNQTQQECPACSSVQSINLFSVSAKRSALHFLSRYRIEKIKVLQAKITKLWGGKQESRFLKCQNCGFMYSWPWISGDKEFYELAFPGQNAESYPNWKWEFQIGMEVLSCSVAVEPNILEIGCGKGEFIKAVLRKGITANITALEYSDYCITEVRKLGVKCTSEGLADLNARRNGVTYDYIFLFQVLEHLDNPNELFSTSWQMLSSEGRLVIGVPNMKRSIFNQKHGALRDIPPYHIGIYSRKSFEVLGQRNGFVLERIEVEPFHAKKHLSLFYSFKYHDLFHGNHDNRLMNLVDSSRIGRKLLMLALLVFNPIVFIKFFISARRIGGGEAIAVFKKRQ